MAAAERRPRGRGATTDGRFSWRSSVGAAVLSEHHRSPGFPAANHGRNAGTVRGIAGGGPMNRGGAMLRVVYHVRARPAPIASRTSRELLRFRAPAALISG